MGKKVIYCIEKDLRNGGLLFYIGSKQYIIHRSLMKISKLYQYFSRNIQFTAFIVAINSLTVFCLYSTYFFLPLHHSTNGPPPLARGGWGWENF